MKVAIYCPTVISCCKDLISRKKMFQKYVC